MMWPEDWIPVLIGTGKWFYLCGYHSHWLGSFCSYYELTNHRGHIL